MYDYTEKMCRDYLIDVEQSDYELVIREEDILAERELARKTAEADGVEVGNYPDNYLESLAVYRKIAETLAADDIILFHGSCIAVDGYAYLFTAKSGTGKSTHTTLWRKVYGDRVCMVNDDKPLIWLSKEGVYIYGTPWDGKHHLSTNTKVRLGGICILNRANGEQNSIAHIGGKEAYPMLLQQTYRPRQTAELLKVLESIDKLANHVPIYDMRCNIDEQAAVMAYEYMSQGCEN